MKIFSFLKTKTRKKTPLHYIYTLLVCLFVSNKRENGWTDRTQSLCGTSHDPRQDLGIIIMCLKVFFCNILKCVKNMMKSANFIFLLYKEKMLTDKATIKSWNRRWARKKPSNINVTSCCTIWFIRIINLRKERKRIRLLNTKNYLNLIISKDRI